MRQELHKLCKCATLALHESFNDGARAPQYLWRVDTKEEAGRRIRAAREAKGWRLEDVSERLPEISVSRLSNWEQGRNMIGVEEAKKLAPLLAVSPGYLLTLEDSPSSQERALLDYFRASDPRGQATILRTAQSESKYAIDEPDAAA